MQGGSLQIKNYSTTDVNIMDPIVVLKNHVPDITVAELLKALKGLAQMEITIDWDLRQFIMNYAENMINNPAEIDLTELCDPFPEQIFDDKNKGYILNYDFGSQDALTTDNFKTLDPSISIIEYNTKFDLPAPAILNSFAVVKNKNKLMQVQLVASVLTWIEYSDYYYPVKVGKGGREIKIELAPMMMTDAHDNYSATSDPNDIKALMPTISETGSSVLFDLGINPPSLRVVFMRGKITGTYGGNYIYASSTNIDINGNIVGDYTLKLQGSDGWYQRFLEKILLAIDNSAVYEYLILLPASYLKYKGKAQIANVNYLFKNVSMFIGKSIKQSVVKLLKL
jgi:hypothetical protein